MICPVCAVDNLPGSDECDNCGADLRGAELPVAHGAFEAVLLRERLADLEPRRPIAVGPDDPVTTAIALMQEHRIGCLTVERGGRLVGILTERDLVQKLAGRPIPGILVRDVMTPDPVVLRDDDTIAVAIHKMAVGGFRHIPLVRGGLVTGIVSARDLSHHLVTLLG
jgi:CBS domain-containing protein